MVHNPLFLLFNGCRSQYNKKSQHQGWLLVVLC
ncbi:hypothetical protein PSYCG_07995 [Psychrobacter sp. G]|nr:hypothetical protein PSYCG_07995 [Psychrobacter sp. G]